MDEERCTEERREMVERQIRARGVRDERVLSAMLAVPRHLFVPESLRNAAYEDHPLPIGSGQTISQPYIVAVMTELLELSRDDRVLEVGTGSGYQAALLSMLAGEVISIERIPEVARKAGENLKAAGIHGVTIVTGDGTEGYPAASPYNAILVTAGTPGIPPPLIDELADGGRLVSPVGDRDYQELVKLVRHGKKIDRSSFGGVIFVPLLGRFGWKG